MEREIAQRQQERFEFYIVSLVFTLLVLSIQTAEFGHSKISDILEITGWIMLVISGVSGLWRLEYLPVERIKLTQRDEYEKNKKSLEIGAKQLNTVQSIPDSIQKYQDVIKLLDPIIKNLERSNLRKYTVHRYSFIVGLCFLVISRSYLPIIEIFFN